VGDLTLNSSVTLNNGKNMPNLGLGVWKIPDGKETVAAVRAALSAGYRHIDTATVYQNEKSVGRAIRESGLLREEIFLTTKVWNDDQGFKAALQACQRSLERLGMEYVDLYLVHWPITGSRLETWRALEQLYRDEYCRSIGVSNFTVRHLEELVAVAQIVPAVNQVEFSPFLFQTELVEFCRSHGIQVEAYSPLTKGKKFQNPKLIALVRKYGKTPAQILIRWALQQGLVVIPKSVRPEHIRENAAVYDFALDPEDLKAMGGWNENYRTAWDPTEIP